MTIDEFLNKHDITPESRARIDAHEARMLLMQEYPNQEDIYRE